MNKLKEKEIPQIIHQMWLDKVDLDNQEPPSKYMKNKFTYTWKNKNPSFHYMFWNREKINILFEHPLLSQWKGFYNKLSYHIEKCDFARYMVIYVYGGIYADLDIECKRSFDGLFGEKDLIFISEKQINLPFNNKQFKSVFNGIFASQSECPFWLDFLSYIVKHYIPYNSPFENTGPKKLGRFINDHPEYEKSIQYLNPCDISSDNITGITGRCYQFNNTPYCTVHFSQGTGWQKEIKSKKTKTMGSILAIVVVIIYFLFMYYVSSRKINQYGQ